MGGEKSRQGPGGHPSRAHLAAFNLGKLAADAQEAVASHIKDCTTCLELLDELDELPDSVIEGIRGDVPPGVFSDGEDRPGSTQPDRESHTPPPREGEAPVGEWPAIPGYQIIDELGRGGMGVVYKAWHAALDRLVAVKMIRDNALADEEDVARFWEEARAVARLQHPNIVQIHEIGEANGRPFFSLEFVDGNSLANRLAGKVLSPRQAGLLVETLARTMHYAHQQGVVHRDLKPANVLLTAVGVVPKISDFGLAKRLDKESGRTRSGAIMGTANYMAPEQASGRVREIGPPADVYALGAILYELLTGRPPFQGKNVIETLEQVVSQEPVRPSTLQPKVPRDLETICLKCLEKDPRRRYASAEVLADRLRLFLEGKPIPDRPVSRTERLWRWCRRNPVVAGLSAAAAVLLAVGVVAGTIGYIKTSSATEDAQQARVREQEHKNQAEQAKAGAQEARVREQEHEKQAEEAKAREQEQEKRANEAKAREQEEARRAQREHDARQRLAYLDDIRLIREAWEEDDINRMRELVEKYGPADNSTDYRDSQWYDLQALSQRYLLKLGAHRGPVRELRGLTSVERPVQRLAWSPDGHRLASVGGRSNVWEVKVWDMATGKECGQLSFDYHCPHIVAWSPDSRRLVAASNNGSVKICDMATGKERIISGGSVTYEVTRTPVVAWSPSGQQLVTIVGDRMMVWDAATWKPIFTRYAQDVPVYSLAWRPDGKWLAAGRRGGTVEVWEAASGKKIFSVSPTEASVAYSLVTWRPDGLQLAAMSIAKNKEGRVLPDLRLKVLDTVTWKETQAFQGRARLEWEDGRSIVWSSDGHWLALKSGLDSTWTRLHRVWEVATGKEMAHVWQDKGGFTLPPRADFLDWSDCRMFWSADCRWISGEWHRKLKVWHLATGKESLSLDLGRLRAWSPTDCRLAVILQGVRNPRDLYCNDRVTIWDPATGQELLTLRGFVLPPGSIDRGTCTLAWSPDSRRLALGSGLGTIKVYNVDIEKESAYPTARVVQLIADLDSDRFLVREKAMQELIGLGEMVKPALWETLNKQPPVEVESRIKHVLRKLAEQSERSR